MDQHIYEKDLINMFDEFGLKILRKKIIRKEPGKVNAFYVLEKNSPEN
jgi:nucleoside diphosphate kinase